MKILTTILILCLAVSLQAWDYQRNNNFYWNFAEEELDWTIDVECETLVQLNRLELHGLNVQEDDYIQLASIRFHPEHYGADYKDYHNTDEDFEKETYLINDKGYSNNARHNIGFYYEFTVFEIPDIQIHDVREKPERVVKTKADGSTVYVSRILELNEVISEIRLFIDIDILNPDCEFIVWLKNISIERLIRFNPEYEDYCQLIIGDRKSTKYKPGEIIELSLRPFYYGFESQIVDIYFVFYNNTDLYFFPSMGFDVEYVSMYLPQFTMSNETYSVGSVNIDDLNPVEGDNYYATGIAPSGTLDFMSDIVLGRIVYSEE